MAGTYLDKEECNMYSGLICLPKNSKIDARGVTIHLAIDTMCITILGTKIENKTEMQIKDLF